MNFKEYQEAAKKTAIYPREHKITYPSLGLSGEAGEVANKVKKVLRDKGGVFDVNTNTFIADEIGDVLWYCANLAEDLGFSLEEIARANIAKLKHRQERGVLKGSGDDR